MKSTTKKTKRKKPTKHKPYKRPTKKTYQSEGDSFDMFHLLNPVM